MLSIVKLNDRDRVAKFCNLERNSSIGVPMPFTLAHPIAAAPIWFGSNRRLHLPGLLVGSLVPDVEYFVALQPAGNLGHQLPGIFLQGLPCAIVLLLLVRYAFWWPFVGLLPNAWEEKIPPLRSVPWRNWGYPLNVWHCSFS
jgi:hypothetical protein